MIEIIIDHFRDEDYIINVKKDNQDYCPPVLSSATLGDLTVEDY